MRDSKNESSSKSQQRERGQGKGRGRERKNYRQNKEDEVETNNNQRGRGQGQNSNRGRGKKVEIQCYNCQKFRYYAFKCWHRKENKVQFLEKEQKMQDDLLLIAYSSLETSESNTWYLDIGTLNHICGSKQYFAKLDKSYSGKIVFGELSRRPVRGKGQIMLELKNRDQRYIIGMSYIPDMKNNILNMGQLLEKVYEIQMKD